ncbi:hypothetical protein RFI_21912, partial [Reticulomyxa filosa]
MSERYVKKVEKQQQYKKGKKKEWTDDTKETGVSSNGDDYGSKYNNFNITIMKKQVSTRAFSKELDDIYGSSGDDQDKQDDECDPIKDDKSVYRQKSSDAKSTLKDNNAKALVRSTTVNSLYFSSKLTRDPHSLNKATTPTATILPRITTTMTLPQAQHILITSSSSTSKRNSPRRQQKPELNSELEDLETLIEHKQKLMKLKKGHYKVERRLSSE